MKKLIFFIFIVFLGCMLPDITKYIYIIHDSIGNLYFTNSFSENNNCVLFLEFDQLDNLVKICGSYNIIKNTDYKGENK